MYKRVFKADWEGFGHHEYIKVRRFTKKSIRAFPGKLKRTILRRSLCKLFGHRMKTVPTDHGFHTVYCRRCLMH